jgi:hypothetical protein
MLVVTVNKKIVQKQGLSSNIQDGVNDISLNKEMLKEAISCASTLSQHIPSIYVRFCTAALAVGF